MRNSYDREGGVATGDIHCSILLHFIRHGALDRIHRMFAYNEYVQRFVQFHFILNPML